MRTEWNGLSFLSMEGSKDRMIVAVSSSLESGEQCFSTTQVSNLDRVVVMDDLTYTLSPL